MYNCIWGGGVSLTVLDVYLADYKVGRKLLYPSAILYSTGGMGNTAKFYCNIVINLNFITYNA